ncbi:methyl-accepting chemotaxis protein [Dongshaea marina]|uniref:methyl-accepting chemotaxis protein n=1 Tax=Dongshaea marina TaxID=2047966 RepID=UPI00131EF787|nr:methyl-accepting chemotaxis protein [Dongshaea marina]
MRISHKVGLLALTAIVGFLIYLSVNNWTLSDNEKRLTQIKNIYFPALEAATIAHGTIKQIDQSLQAAVTTAEEDAITAAKKQYKELQTQLDILQQLLPDEQRQLEKVSNMAKIYLRQGTGLAQGIIDDTIDMSAIGGQARQINQLKKELEDQLRTFKNSSDQAFSEVIAQSLDSSHTAKAVGFWLGSITILLVLLVSAWSIRSTVRSIAKVSDSLKEIAQGEGDLTVRIQYKGSAEIEELVHWFNLFIEKLQRSIKSITESTSTLSRVTETLSMTSSSTQDSVQAQKDAVTQASGAIEMMADSVQQVSSFANQASTEASDANDSAHTGKQIVQSTAQGVQQLANEVKNAAEVIQQLDAHSSNVGAILETIQGIAEQTNLLALNAAIEAARAGEQGRGFAVVADEVRTLASRTQSSTKEIQQVLDQLQKSSQSAVEAILRGTSKADESVDQSHQADESLSQITTRVEAIYEANNQIAASTTEQTESSNRIRSNISEIEQVSMIVSQSSEEMDQVSHQIQEVATQLQEVLDQFRV